MYHPIPLLCTVTAGWVLGRETAGKLQSGGSKGTSRLERHISNCHQRASGSPDGRERVVEQRQRVLYKGVEKILLSYAKYQQEV